MKELSECFSKHLAKHFHESHNINVNFNATILQNNFKSEAGRRNHEGEWICKLKTLAAHALNTKVDDYAKEMYNFY